MILAVFAWICALTICQCRIITINNEGSNEITCCTSKLCPCSSLDIALTYLKHNTVVNITSKQVTLDSHVVMGERNNNSRHRKLNNIFVYGNGAVVMCNYKGSVGCESCSNIVFEGITWDRCATSEYLYGITFVNAIDITVSMCTFQHFNSCIGAAFFMASGFVTVTECQFLSNYVGYVSNHPPIYAALFITTYENSRNALQSINVNVTETSFYDNGIFYESKQRYSTINMWLFQRSLIYLYIDNSTVSASAGLGGNFTLENAVRILAIFDGVTFTHNNGGSQITIVNRFRVGNLVSISSCKFAHNTNGSLKVVVSAPIGSYGLFLNKVVIIGNKGTFSEDIITGSNSIGQGTGILIWFASLISYIEISDCSILNNDGGDSSIVYAEHVFGSQTIKIVSSVFAGNHGPALYLSDCSVKLEGYLSFSDNTAPSGSAIYLAHNSQIMIGNDSTLEFTNNVALLFGGAIYVDLPMDCPNQGITFKDLSNGSFVLFTNNSAEIAGNSLYFSIPESCNIIRDSSDNNSIVYTPYQFTYVPLPGSVAPEISTSPYAVNLCSTECNAASNCFIRNENMLGQSILFNATTCDYYSSVGEPVQFVVECIDCNNNYRLSDSKILAHNGVSELEVLTLNANSDVSANRNITINMTSIRSHGYKQLTGVVSIELSPCHVGYVFDTNLHQCKCYNEDSDIILCKQDYVGIKYGYWFGTVTSEFRTFSSCPTYYCDFAKQTETRDGFFNLPKEQSDQCSSHRAGMACGECKLGYTLAYDSPDCINRNECSPGMTALVVILTILYWVVVVVVVFALMYFIVKISLGYTYGLLFYYSVVDILLGSNLYISVPVFQVTTILSSFAKLTPQFLGKLCFIKDLSGIDQQFIHYVHALAVFLLTGVIAIIARRWPNRIALSVGHCIIRVTCLLLLLAYTSLASTSLQLLRPLYYHDINGAYVYLSPSIKYFTNRHVGYSIIALILGLFIVIGFPLLLLLEPFLRGKFNFIKLKPLLDQFQGCYKDRCHLFAAYYLICRLIIIATAFFNALYYLQTVSITIIAMIHICIQPYKSDTLNKLDGVILLTMVLIINLASYTFTQSTTTTLVIIFVIFPLCLSLAMFFYFSLLSKWIDCVKNNIATARYVVV